MKISACYITKNEAATLPRSLASIAGAYDELLVVDTGSTDETVAIAERAGARVLSFAWQDDFSAARNFALAQATGDWVIFLDADEYFTEATQGHIRAAIAAHSAADVLLVRRTDVDAAGETVGHIYVARIMRRREGLRYAGIIHEELCQNGVSVSNVAWLAPEELALTHTGYAGPLGEAKARRNLRLLRLAQAQSAHPEHYDSYLAETYFGLDDIPQAMRYAQRDIARGRQATTYASKSWRILLQCLLTHPAYNVLPAEAAIMLTAGTGTMQATDAGEEQPVEGLTAAVARLQVATSAVTAFPELPDFYAERAEAEAALLDFAAAVTDMQRALALAADYRGIEPSMFSGETAAQGEARLALWQRIVAAQDTIRITACCIAKNEAANITAWVENAAAYSDVRLVVDTGSTDDTVALARQAGCRVEHFAWCDDFAAAKNAALAFIPEEATPRAQADGGRGVKAQPGHQAKTTNAGRMDTVGEATTAQWVAFPDADETWLVPDRVRPFLAWLTVTQPEAEAVQCLLHNVDGGRVFQSFPAVRLFRRRAGLAYAGRVHETLQKADGSAIWTWQDTDLLAIRHTGYSQSQMAAKAARDLALLDQEPADDARLWRFRADAHFALGQLAEAEQCGLQAILSPWQGQGSESDMYWLVLTCMQLREEKWEERLALAQAAAAKFPQLPDYPARIGLAFYRRGEAAAALPYLAQARQLAAQPQTAQASHYGEIAAETNAVWALCQAQALAQRGNGPVNNGGVVSDAAHGEMQAAQPQGGGADQPALQTAIQQAMDTALRVEPDNEQVLTAFADWQLDAGEDAATVAQALQGYVGADERALTFLAHWAERSGFLGLYQHYAQVLETQYGRTLPRADLYALAAAGKWQELGEACVAGLSTDTRLLVELLLALEREQPGLATRQLQLQARHALPAVAEDAWEAYEQGGTVDTQDGFGALWPLVRQTGTAEQCARFAGLVRTLDPAKYQQCARDLMADEQWQGAAAIFGQVDAADADAAFWQDIGICMYHLREYDAMRECFATARAQGLDSPQMQTFTAWAAEDAAQ